MLKFEFIKRWITLEVNLLLQQSFLFNVTLMFIEGSSWSTSSYCTHELYELFDSESGRKILLLYSPYNKKPTSISLKDHW